MFPRNTMAAAVVDHTSAAVVVGTSAVAGHTSAVDKLGPVASRQGAGPAHPLWLGVDPDLVSV
jgi:hypothetical protein